MAKILNTPYPTGADTGILKMSITYVQESDCNKADSNMDNYITISTEDVPTNDDEQYYYVVSTERWTFNEPEEVNELVNDFKRRLFNNKNKKENETD